MAEATKIGQDAAKATITFIENNTRGSSKASCKAVITRVDDAGKALKYVAVKTATAGGAASAEAGNRGDKRKAEEPPFFAGVAPKVAPTITRPTCDSRPSPDGAVSTGGVANRQRYCP